MKKPLPCNQKWDEMLLTDGGRICTGCGKLVIDFRKFKWKDIEITHKSNSIPTCGIYDNNQLNYWGQEVPSKKYSCSKFLQLSATLLAMSQLVPTSIEAQTKLPSTVITIKKHGETVKEKQTSRKIAVVGTVVEHITDSSKLPLLGVEIVVQCDADRFSTLTDSLGRFSIDITEQFQSLPRFFSVHIIHPDFLLEHVIVDKNNLQPLDIILSNDITIISSKVSIVSSSFYSVAPEKTDTIARIKKWWQFKRKK